MIDTGAPQTFQWRVLVSRKGEWMFNDLVVLVLEIS